MFLKVFGFFIVLLSGLFIFGARSIVEKYNLQEKQKCDYESELREEEIELYKMNKAIINVKMMGLLLALPGIAIILIVFK